MVTIPANTGTFGINNFNRVISTKIIIQQNIAIACTTYYFVSAITAINGIVIITFILDKGIITCTPAQRIIAIAADNSVIT